MSSELSNIKARLAVQEKLTGMLLTGLEEIKVDMAESFKQSDLFQEEQLTVLRTELKADMAAMEARILDAFKQLVAVLNARPGPTTND